MIPAPKEAGLTVAAVDGYTADDPDNVQFLQGGITYVADSPNALGVTGAVHSRFMTARAQ